MGDATRPAGAVLNLTGAAGVKFLVRKQINLTGTGNNSLNFTLAHALSLSHRERPVTGAGR